MTDAAAQPEAPRIALARAAGVFAATLSSFLAIGAVITILPRYVSGPLAGGDVAVGVIVGAFAFSAVVTRPLAGRLADARGRRRVAIAGALVIAAGGALYFAPLGFGGLMAARLVLGVGDALVVTAGAAWTVDLAPVSRRGQAIGLFGLAIWGGLSLGPPIGEALFALGSYELVWAFAVVAPLVGAVLASRVPDAHVPAPRSAGGGPLIPVASRRPGVALLLANVGYAALAGFVVLHLEAQGDGRGPLVFTVFAVAVVATRLLAGRLPDRLGARRTAVVAALCEAAGLVAVAVAGGAGVAIAGAVLMGDRVLLHLPGARAAGHRARGPRAPRHGARRLHGVLRRRRRPRRAAGRRGRGAGRVPRRLPRRRGVRAGGRGAGCRRAGHADGCRASGTPASRESVAAARVPPQRSACT